MNPVFVALVALRADLRVVTSARYVTRPLWIAYFTRKGRIQIIKMEI